MICCFASCSLLAVIAVLLFPSLMAGAIGAVLTPFPLQIPEQRNAVKLLDHITASCKLVESFSLKYSSPTHTHTHGHMESVTVVHTHAY